MGFSLHHHWKDSLDSCPKACAKVYRFLASCYGRQAMEMTFPPQAPLETAPHFDVEARPKLPMSPERIRSLLVKIAEAVADSLPDDRG